MADSKIDDPQTQAGESGTSKGSSTDWESKYVGLSRLFDEKQKELVKLKSTHESLTGEHEAELVRERTAAREAIRLQKEAEVKLSATETEKASVLKELNAVKVRETTRATIRDKHPELLEVFEDGILKDADQFPDNDAYIAYLEKASARFGGTPKEESEDSEPPEPVPAPKTPKVTGTVPPAAGSRRNSTSQRSETDILNDLNDSDGTTSAGAAKQVKLYEELDAVRMAARK